MNWFKNFSLIFLYFYVFLNFCSKPCLEKYTGGEERTEQTGESWKQNNKKLQKSKKWRRNQRQKFDTSDVKVFKFLQSFSTQTVQSVYTQPFSLCLFIDSVCFLCGLWYFWVLPIGNFLLSRLLPSSSFNFLYCFNMQT